MSARQKICHRYISYFLSLGYLYFITRKTTINGGMQLSENFDYAKSDPNDLPAYTYMSALPEYSQAESSASSSQLPWSPTPPPPSQSERAFTWSPTPGRSTQPPTQPPIQTSTHPPTHPSTQLIKLQRVHYTPKLKLQLIRFCINSTE